VVAYNRLSQGAPGETLCAPVRIARREKEALKCAVLIRVLSSGCGGVLPMCTSIVRVGKRSEQRVLA
jgi:hypothetical protein